MTLTAEQWTERFAKRLGTSPPTDKERDALLGLAGVAAHASERTAAPISSWLTARAGVAPSDALRAANELAEELQTEN
jgi:hypothetical protein